MKYRFQFILYFLTGFYIQCLGVIPVLKKGEIHGILTSKGEAWIEVKDDKGFLHRYLAPWEGKGPARGGSFKEEIISKIDSLVVGNRVLLLWYWNGHLRVENVQVILPKWKKSLFEGYVLEIGDKWIDVQNKNEGVPWRFYLPWVGGYPHSGGGYDEKILEPLREHEPTSPIIFEWKYELRPRIVKLFTREEITTKPFYEIDEIPPWLGPVERVLEPSPSDILALSSKKQKRIEPARNPFLSKRINPFDSVKNSTINPFDNVPKKQLNPFEGISSPHVPKSLNPFDTVTNSTINPFNISQKKAVSNPFDQLSNQSSKISDSLLRKKLSDLIIAPVSFTQTPLPQVLLELIKPTNQGGSNQKSISILCKLNSGHPLPKVTVKLKSIPLNQALKKVTEGVGWIYEISGDTVIVSPGNKNPFEQVLPNKKAKSLNPFDQIQ